MPRPKKASGASVPEAQRHTVRVVVRLPPDTAAALRERAARSGRTISGMVSALIAEAEAEAAR